jgi:hypothetical protein
MVKLVKSTSAFAGAENVGIFVDDFWAVSGKAAEDFFAFHHTDLALESHCRFHAPDPVTLPEDDWGHDFLHFLANSVAILGIPADVCKMFGERVSSSVSPTTIPIRAKFLPPIFDYLPNIDHMLLCMILEVELSLANVGLAGYL